VEIMDTYVKTTISQHKFEVQSIKKKIHGNIYECEVALEDKVYMKAYYNHQQRSVVVNEILAKI
jgi:hypothetical protein